MRHVACIKAIELELWLVVRRSQYPDYISLNGRMIDERLIIKNLE